jgi:PAS domain S-box-containing protein
LTGYDHDELIGKNTRFLQGPLTSSQAVESMRHAVKNLEDCVVEVLNYRKDGSTFWNQVAISPVRNESGDVVNFIGVQTDVSERRELERQLMHSQKMESLGVMASGIAHDVNNVLLVIRGYSALLAHRTTDAETRDVVEQIDSAVQHAADFTRQLLSLTKGQIVHSQISDLNEVVRETLNILEHMIGTDVVIEAKLAKGSLWADVDRGLVEQAVLNLVANARDAMPSGGVLSVETASVELGDRYSEMYSNVTPGRYIMLQVADSGEGMDENTQNHAFDPFFTTKPRGTGLGLSTVYGAVTQNGGHLRLHSEPGKGTVFKLYFPAMLDETVGRDASGLGRDITGPATLLVVENNDDLRHRLMDELVHSGFVVLEAVSGADARRLLADSRATVDLAFVDVDSGSGDEFDFVDEMLAENTETRVVVATTRFGDIAVRDRLDASRSAVVHKPFALDSVATVVDGMLRPERIGSSGATETAHSRWTGRGT